MRRGGVYYGAGARQGGRGSNGNGAMVRRLTGVRYAVPLREGGSLPAVVDTDEAGPYVVKFRGAGQGAKALIAELLVAELAGELGLPLPAHALVEIDAGFGQGEPDPEIQDILRGSTGLNFGLAFLPGAIGFDAAVDRAVAAVPDEWLAGEPNFADAGAYRDAWVEYLTERLRGTGGQRAFVREAIDAAARVRLV